MNRAWYRLSLALCAISICSLAVAQKKTGHPAANKPAHGLALLTPAEQQYRKQFTKVFGLASDLYRRVENLDSSYSPKVGMTPTWLKRLDAVKADTPALMSAYRSLKPPASFKNVHAKFGTYVQADIKYITDYAVAARDKSGAKMKGISDQSQKVLQLQGEVGIALHEATRSRVKKH